MVSGSLAGTSRRPCRTQKCRHKGNGERMSTIFELPKKKYRPRLSRRNGEIGSRDHTEYHLARTSPGLPGDLPGAKMPAQGGWRENFNYFWAPKTGTCRGRVGAVAKRRNRMKFICFYNRNRVGGPRGNPPGARMLTQGGWREDVDDF